MKKMLFTLLLTSAVTAAIATPPVNEKVMKQFETVFPTVENARWFENDGNYEVYFIKDDVQCHISYNQNGKVISTRRYYSGAQLCPFIKSKVTEKFAGKSIFGVTEITNRNELLYVIVLEDENTWTNVQSNSVGELTVLEKMQKAK